MDAETSCCVLCSVQPQLTTPHPDLELVSRLPRVSSIYLCSRCRTPWMRFANGEWDAMLGAELPQPVREHKRYG